MKKGYAILTVLVPVVDGKTPTELKNLPFPDGAWFDLVVRPDMETKDIQGFVWASKSGLERKLTELFNGGVA